MSLRQCRFSELPDDVQTFLSEMVGCSGTEELLDRLRRHRFKIRNVPASAFPAVPVWTDYRDRAYTEEMVGKSLPPAIICGKQWLDGRHRVWAWRRAGREQIPCIDLAEIGFSYPFKPVATLNI